MDVMRQQSDPSDRRPGRWSFQSPSTPKLVIDGLLTLLACGGTMLTSLWVSAHASTQSHSRPAIADMIGSNLIKIRLRVSAVIFWRLWPERICRFG